MQAENFYIEGYIQVSNFPFAWWNKTITIYNKLIDPTTQKVSWYRAVVENCFWKAVNSTYTIGSQGKSSTGIMLETKSIICRIPKSENYVDKRTWKGLLDKSDTFTLGNGDIIVLGEVDDVIDEYTAGQRSTDLITKYKEFDECLEIDSYTDNTGLGLGIEHYKIIGK